MDHLVDVPIPAVQWPEAGDEHLGCDWLVLVAEVFEWHAIDVRHGGFVAIDGSNGVSDDSSGGRKRVLVVQWHADEAGSPRLLNGKRLRPIVAALCLLMVAMWSVTVH